MRERRGKRLEPVADFTRRDSGPLLGRNKFQDELAARRPGARDRATQRAAGKERESLAGKRRQVPLWVHPVPGPDFLANSHDCRFDGAHDFRRLLGRGTWRERDLHRYRIAVEWRSRFDRHPSAPHQTSGEGEP